MFKKTRIIGTLLAVFLAAAPALTCAAAANADSSTASSSLAEHSIFDEFDELNEATTGSSVDATEPADTSSYDAEESAEGEEVQFAVSTTETVDEAFNGVVQVNLVFTDENKGTLLIQGGTGFLIGSADGTEYVITNTHIVEPAASVKKAAYKYYKIPKKEGSWNYINPEVRIVLENDITIGATIVKASEDLDVAVLQLEQPLYNRTPLTFLVSDPDTKEKPYITTDVVYALGFPYEVTYEKPYTHTNEQVSMAQSTISNVTVKNGSEFIVHSAQILSNNCGGPLVNNYGMVLGVDSIDSEGTNYYAVDATVITRILDGLGLVYSKMTKSEYELWLHRNDPPVIEATTSTSNNGAVVVIDNGGDTIPGWLIAMVIGLGVILLAAIGAIVFLMIRTDSLDTARVEARKAKKEAKREAKEAKKAAENPIMHPIENVHTVSERMDTGMIGGAAANETTVLGAGNPNMVAEPKADQGMAEPPRVTSGTLIRRKNADNIIIDKQTFAIGKDSLHVDYCITDNPAVSRVHARINTINNRVFIEDCNSTNGVCVNGVRLQGGGQQELTNGCLVKIADEEFEYRV